MTAGSDFHRPRSTCFVAQDTTHGWERYSRATFPCHGSQFRLRDRLTVHNKRDPHLLLNDVRSRPSTGGCRGRFDRGQLRDLGVMLKHGSRTVEVATRGDLLASGMSVRQIAAEVHRGRLIRIRRGYYCLPELDEPTRRAVRVGGRLACCSELRHLGIWTLTENDHVHLHVAGNSSRLRDPDNPSAKLSNPRACVVHWGPLIAPTRGTPGHIAAIDALAQAMVCLPPRAALAAADSALHLGKLRRRDLDRIAPTLPAARRALLGQVDSGAGSGLETLVRKLARDLGFTVRTQVWIDGVGRIDVLVEDWIVVETDGDEFHDVPVIPRDRRRDAAVVASGRAAIRLRYAQVVHDPNLVARVLIGAVESHRRVRNSGWKAQRARRRLEKLDLA